MSAIYILKVWATDWPQFEAEVPICWHGGLRQMESILKPILSGFCARHGNMGWFGTVSIFIPLPPEGERANYEPWKPLQSYQYMRSAGAGRGGLALFKMVKTSLQDGRLAKAMAELPAWASAMTAPYDSARYRKDVAGDPYMATAAAILAQREPKRPDGWPMGLLPGSLFYPTGRAERRRKWFTDTRRTQHVPVYYAYRWTQAQRQDHAMSIGLNGESAAAKGVRHLPARGELIAADLTHDEAGALVAYMAEKKPEEGYSYEFTKQFIGENGLETVFEHCHGNRDGDCFWGGCPQNKIGEPMLTGRHCPLDRNDDDER